MYSDSDGSDDETATRHQFYDACRGFQAVFGEGLRARFEDAIPRGDVAFDLGWAAHAPLARRCHVASWVGSGQRIRPLQRGPDRELLNDN